MNGKEVSNLVSQVQAPGYYQYDFDGSNLPSGTYFYKFQTADFTSTKKFVLVK